MKSTPVMGESSIVLTFKGISCPISKKLVQKRTRIKTINPQNNKTVTSVWIYNRGMTCQERRNRVNQRGSQIFRKNKLAIERFFRSPLALMFWRWFWRSLAVQRRILRSPGVFSARATLQRGVVERRGGPCPLFLRNIWNENFDFHVFESLQFVFRRKTFSGFWKTL